MKSTVRPTGVVDMGHSSTLMQKKEPINRPRRHVLVGAEREMREAWASGSMMNGLYRVRA